MIDTRHEQAAAHAGDGYARLTRGPGVALVTAGPGLPMPSPVSPMPTKRSRRSSFWAVRPRFAPSGEGRCKRWSSYQCCARSQVVSHLHRSAAAARDGADRAAGLDGRHAGAGLPGAAVRHPDGPGRPQRAGPPPPLPSWPRTQADPESLAAAVALLAQAEHPVIFAGSQVYWEGAHSALGQLCATTHIPVVMNGMGRGTLPADHPRRSITLASGRCAARIWWC